MRTSRHVPHALLAAALVLASPATAQMLVSGQLLDVASDAPIADGTIVLTASRGAWQATAHTDSAGNFAFDVVTPGSYRLRASRLGYRDAGGDVRLTGDSSVTLEVRMAVQTVALQPVTVVARSERRMSPEMRGFYDRMRHGPGHFITRDHIEARHASRLTDVLRTLPNIRAATSRTGMSRSTLSHGSNGGRCSLVFFVDGIRLNQPAPPGMRAMELVIDDYVSPGDVEGIEVYRGQSETPAQFITGNVHCGTVVIWTRRGPL